MKKIKKQFDLFIVLDDLTAEGCPILALNLIDEFRKNNLKILLLRFHERNDELLGEFHKRRVDILSYKLKSSGVLRYLKIIYLSFIFSIKYRPSSVLCFPLGWHSLVAIGARLAGIKNICVHAGNLPPDRRDTINFKFKIWIYLGYFFTTKIICCSKYIEDSFFKNFKLARNRIAYIYNSFDEKKFKYIKKLKIDKKKKELKEIIICMVGRLEVHKDQFSLIRSIDILMKEKIKVKLYLVGDGSNKMKLKELTKSLNLTKNVLFLGSRNDVNEILDKVDIFAFSTTHDEGFGIALTEAMGKGLPIIASDVGACREILLDGECGFLVKSFSEKAIADGVIEIINNIKIVEKRRKLAYLHATKNFNKKKMSIKYLEALELD